ncbi:MAG TPA: RES family NAD+ phosphorylase [Chitinophagaceae bacterium]|jgi:RES domain-containing protein|nr:RES family NAD+ phosphorylase [Chitinophagaceae bacterium]
MELYRITQESYSNDLSGDGSRIFGGRWNSEGRYALYTSANRSLALLETLAHIPAKLFRNKKYILVTVFLPDKAPLKFIEEKDLPNNWDALDIQHVTQKIGDNFLEEQKGLLFRVPSVLMPEEFNYIINPLHPSMKQVKVIHHREIRFNDRLIKTF